MFFGMTSARARVARVDCCGFEGHGITSSCSINGFACVKIRHVRFFEALGSILLRSGSKGFELIFIPTNWLRSDLHDAKT